MLSDEVLKHVGVKGMKWGVRRDRNRPGGADGKFESEKVTDTRGRLAKNIDSLRRERNWRKVLNDVDKLTTKEITTVSKRVSLENDLKRLSKTKMAKPKDKEDYLRRDKMSNDELSRKVVRLRAKDSLYKNVSDASKEQREFGEKVVNVAKGVSMKLAVRKVTGKPLQSKDFYDILKNPKDGSKSAQADLQKQIINKITNKAKT